MGLCKGHIRSWQGGILSDCCWESCVWEDRLEFPYFFRSCISCLCGDADVRMQNGYDCHSTGGADGRI